MTLEQHIEELRAELSWNDDPKEQRLIMDEIWLCELIQIAKAWKAQAAVAKAG